VTRVASIFSQILQLFPRQEFEAEVRKQKAERHARGFTCWGQFVAMLFCQLGRAHSLREICNGLSASEGKLKHLGLPAAPNRSTLSYANEHRPWQLFESVFDKLYGRCSAVAQAQGQRKFALPKKLLSMDSTMISLCTSLYPWAKYMRRKGAVKIHLVLDHDGYLPQFAVVTDGKKSDVQVALKTAVGAGQHDRHGPGLLPVSDGGWGWRGRKYSLFYASRRMPNLMWCGAMR
jgi:hypothetical protein